MPANKINQPANTFVKGLITEASPLTFPENASLDEVNFKLNRDGSRDKRWGQQHIYYETLPYTRLELEKLHAKVYKWEQPKGARHSVIGVVQIGYLLYFVDITVQPVPTPYDDLLIFDTPAPLLNGGVAVDAGNLLSGGKPVEFATINGYLLLLCEEVENPFIAWYDDEADLVSFDYGDILVRDIWGVDDGLALDARPAELSETHRYNLLNQGWTNSIITTCGTPVLDCVKSHFGVYPSNNDSWGIGRTADLTSADVYKFDPAIAERNLVNNQPAAKGHFHLPIYRRGSWRNTLTGATVPTDLEESFFTTIESYAGRAWFSGVRGKVLEGDDRSPNLCQAVLFSQVMETPLDLVKCYQEADPTSYDFNEVVDTDGGIIFINGCSFVHKIKAIKSSLWVFGDNGVWEIRGSGEQGFTATSFEVRKINSIGICAKDSVVDANGVIFYWSYSGIYAIQPDPNLNGIYNTINVTQPTIQTRYDDFDTYTKMTARGIYDPYNNKIRWLFADYSSAPSLTGEVEASVFVAECNTQPTFGVHPLSGNWLPSLEGNRVILFTHKDSISPDYVVNYAYVYAVDTTGGSDIMNFTSTVIRQITNAQVVAFNNTTYMDLFAHCPVYGSTSNYVTNIHYFYSSTPTTALKLQNLTFDGTTDLITLSGTPTTINTSCRNIYPLLSAARLTSTKFVIAFHNTSNKASVQVVNSNGTYGAVVSSTNNVYADSAMQYLSVAELSSTKAVFAYKDNTWGGATIDYLSIATNTITVSSTTLFPNATQMPTGTTTFEKQRILNISSVSNKFLVTGLLTNASLGYTRVLSCFIVTISGTTLTSTTILNIPEETGTTKTEVIPIQTGEYRATIIYNDNDQAYVDGYDPDISNRLRYIDVDFSGTTPVLLGRGNWAEPVGAAWVDSNVHAHIPLNTVSYDTITGDHSTLVTAYRNTGSLGSAGVALYAGTTP